MLNSEEDNHLQSVSVIREQLFHEPVEVTCLPYKTRVGCRKILFGYCVNWKLKDILRPDGRGWRVCGKAPVTIKERMKVLILENIFISNKLEKRGRLYQTSWEESFYYNDIKELYIDMDNLELNHHHESRVAPWFGRSELKTNCGKCMLKREVDYVEKHWYDPLRDVVWKKNHDIVEIKQGGTYHMWPKYMCAHYHEWITQRDKGIKAKIRVMRAIRRTITSVYKHNFVDFMVLMNFECPINSVIADNYELQLPYLIVACILFNLEIDEKLKMSDLIVLPDEELVDKLLEYYCQKDYFTAVSTAVSNGNMLISNGVHELLSEIREKRIASASKYLNEIKLSEKDASFLKKVANAVIPGFVKLCNTGVETPKIDYNYNFMHDIECLFSNMDERHVSSSGSRDTFN
jgi:hypothetical protein